MFSILVISYLVMCSFHGVTRLYYLVLCSPHAVIQWNSMVVPSEDLVLHRFHSIMYSYNSVMSSFYFGYGFFKCDFFKLIMSSFSLIMQAANSVMCYSLRVLSSLCALCMRSLSVFF